MDDERLEMLKSEVEDGSLRKGFLFVSRSTYWLPWMVGSVTDRIEVGLFSEYLPNPDGPAFAIEWRTTFDGVAVEVRAPAEAWQSLPYLTGLNDLILELATSRAASMSADEFALKLQEQNYAESLWAALEEDECPLPPPERLPEGIGFFGDDPGKPAADEPTWVGPHIGRTARFLQSVDQFIAELIVEEVPALDIKAGYQDSAFHRLWEAVDQEAIIDDRLLAASGRTNVYDVPYAVTDTHAYLMTALRETEKAMRRCGVPEGLETMTLIEPISEVIFQLWQTTPEDFDRLQSAFEVAAGRVGLRVIWDEERPSVGLPDNDDYRPQSISP